MVKFFKLREERGFSLVELMIVVAIIAILAAIAIPAFMRFALKSKTAEAKGNLSAIRTCEEAYRAENDVYIKCLESPKDLNDPPSEPQKWVEEGDPLAVPPTAFSAMGFEADGAVRYTYLVTVIEAAGGDPPAFEVVARGDLDDNGLEGFFIVTKGEDTYPKPVWNNEY